MKTTYASLLHRLVFIFTVLSFWMSNTNANLSATGHLSASDKDTKTSNSPPTIPSPVVISPSLGEDFASNEKLKLLRRRKEVSRGSLSVSSLMKKSLLLKSNTAVDTHYTASREEGDQLWNRLLLSFSSYSTTIDAKITLPPVIPKDEEHALKKEKPSKKPKSRKTSTNSTPQKKVVQQGKTW